MLFVFCIYFENQAYGIFSLGVSFTCAFDFGPFELVQIELLISWFVLVCVGIEDVFVVHGHEV